MLQNVHEVVDDTAKVFLSQDKVTLIDAVDWDKVKSVCWCAIYNQTGKRWYACGRVNNKTIYMHRFILGVTDRHELIDHKDQDGLNNRRDNLRPVNRSQNAQNVTKARSSSKTGVLGVSVHKCKPSGLMYCARVNVTVDGKVKSKAKYFPHTTEGLQAATEAVKLLRAEVMTHSDGR